MLLSPKVLFMRKIAEIGVIPTSFFGFLTESPAGQTAGLSSKSVTIAASEAPFPRP